MTCHLVWGGRPGKPGSMSGVIAGGRSKREIAVCELSPTNSGCPRRRSGATYYTKAVEFNGRRRRLSERTGTKWKARFALGEWVNCWFFRAPASETIVHSRSKLSCGIARVGGNDFGAARQLDGVVFEAKPYLLCPQWSVVWRRVDLDVLAVVGTWTSRTRRRTPRCRIGTPSS